MSVQSFIPLAKRYEAVAVENPRFPAIIRDNQVISHEGFWEVVKLFAHKMQMDGVRSNSLVALNTKEILASLAVLFATSLLGARLVIASTILASFKILKPTHFYRTPEVAGSKRVDFRVIDNSWIPSIQNSVADIVNEFAPAPDSDWLYLHTSGTTGHAKYIALSEKMVWDRTCAVAQDFPFQKTTLATTFAATSRPFFARAIATLLNAGAVVDSRDFELWVGIGVNLVCGSPRQLGELFESVTLPVKLPRVEVSGAKLHDDVAATLLKGFDRVVDVYGAAETSKSFENIVTIDHLGEIVRHGRQLDSDIQIVRSDGELCTIGQTGSVRVRNPYMATGYMNAPEATAKSFRDGWFSPGDIAAWGKNKELLIIGREDDVINIGGYKINGGMIDLLFRSVSGIRDAISFPNPKVHSLEKVLVFVVFEENASRANAIEAACNLARDKLGIVMGIGNIMAIDAIPKTEKETPDREACRRLALARIQDKR